MYTVIFKDFKSDLFVYLKQSNESVNILLNWYLDQSSNIEFETEDEKMTIAAGSVVSIEVK